MRKFYLDNLRWILVLLLFPYHTSMLYNDWDESFYVFAQPHVFFSDFLRICWPWYMPLMFVIAGMSARYALEKRSSSVYIRERVSKLLIPLIFGILLLVPVQTFFAEKFHNNYQGGYFAQYVPFFTKPTNLTGYHGGFTPGQLWFILYLFAISLLALPLFSYCKKQGKHIPIEKLTLGKILLLFLIPLIMSPVLDIGGKSVGTYFSFFVLAYFVLSDECVLAMLQEKRKVLGAAFVSCAFLSVVLYRGLQMRGIMYDVFSGFYGWIGILFWLGFSRQHFNQNNRICAYLSAASFPVYLIHQSCLVLIAFYVLLWTDRIVVQAVSIPLLSFALTLMVYEVFRRIRPLRWMFGIKR